MLDWQNVSFSYRFQISKKFSIRFRFVFSLRLQRKCRFRYFKSNRRCISLHFCEGRKLHSKCFSVRINWGDCLTVFPNKQNFHKILLTKNSSHFHTNANRSLNKEIFVFLKSKTIVSLIISFLNFALISFPFRFRCLKAVSLMKDFFFVFVQGTTLAIKR